MKIGDEVFVHGYVDEIRKDVIIIRNNGGYFGTIEGEIVIADTPQTDCEDAFTKWQKSVADSYRPQTDCETCKYGQDKHRYAHICNECGVGINNYAPQTESTGSPIGDYRDGVGAWQTDCGWK